MPLDTTHYDRAAGVAMAELDDQVRRAWRLRYLAEEGAELRAAMLLERAETQMLAVGRPATIRDLWMTIADRVATENDLDVRAAAALIGLRNAWFLDGKVRPSPCNNGRFFRRRRPSSDSASP